MVTMTSVQRLIELHILPSSLKIFTIEIARSLTEPLYDGEFYSLFLITMRVLVDFNTLFVY